MHEAAIRRQWYLKLKDEGFEDIERMDRSGSMDSPFMDRTASSIAARYCEFTAEYYRAASHFLHECQFDSQLEYFCWALHAEGIAYRDIVKSLKQAGIKQYSLFKIQGIIRGTREKMMAALRSWDVDRADCC